MLLAVHDYRYVLICLCIFTADTASLNNILHISVIYLMPPVPINFEMSFLRCSESSLLLRNPKFNHHIHKLQSLELVLSQFSLSQTFPPKIHFNVSSHICLVLPNTNHVFPWGFQIKILYASALMFYVTLNSAFQCIISDFSFLLCFRLGYHFLRAQCGMWLVNSIKFFWLVPWLSTSSQLHWLLTKLYGLCNSVFYVVVYQTLTLTLYRVHDSETSDRESHLIQCKGRKFHLQ
jgi:hypothetical protein